MAGRRAVQLIGPQRREHDPEPVVQRGSPGIGRLGQVDPEGRRLRGFQIACRGPDRAQSALAVGQFAFPGRQLGLVQTAEPAGGLYRSDDAGRSWRLLSGDRRIQTRSWYYMDIIADPKNADVVQKLQPMGQPIWQDRHWV
mgnify:CR=1 FL=1